MLGRVMAGLGGLEYMLSPSQGLELVTVTAAAVKEVPHVTENRMCCFVGRYGLSSVCSFTCVGTVLEGHLG